MNRKIRTICAILAMGMLFSGCKLGWGNDRPDNRHRSDDPVVVSEPSVLQRDDKDIDRTGMNIADIDDATYDQATQNAYLDFAIDLYANCASGTDSNMMVSPASVLFAMGMTSAGACGDTLDQMVSTMTPRQDALSMHAFAREYNRRLNTTDDISVHSANSIWLNGNWGGNVYSDFLDYCTETYDAQISSVAFDGEGIAQMNGWVNDQTDGMIPSIISGDLDPDAVMVLINAIAFEADWTVPYEGHMVSDGLFHNLDGSDSDVTMLREEDGQIYYETDLATGFARYYGEDQEYYFLAMLPKDETISANEFASSLTASDYNEFLASRTNDYTVISAIPEFESDYEIYLNDVLMNMGIVDAFMDDGTADFSNMCDRAVYISTVLQKTHIEVDREGTSAAAATAVMVSEATAIAPDYDNTRYVILDRPFAYAIVEASTGLPLFIGTVDSL